MSGLFAFGPNAASASTVVDSTEPIYQQWADEAAVPTPPGTIKVTNGQCPFIKAYACTRGREIYSPINDPRVWDHGRQLFYHELGHIYRRYVITLWSQFLLLRDVIPHQTWTAATEEEFGELYSLCAAAVTRRNLYYAIVTPAQIARGCQIMEQAFWATPTRQARRTSRQCPPIRRRARS